MIDRDNKAFNPQYVTHMYWTPTIPVDESKSDQEVLIIQFQSGSLEFTGEDAKDIWNYLLWGLYD